MHKTYGKGLMWFRRDLRSEDNAALFSALKFCRQVFCVFVFDREILDALARADRRVEFIRESLVDLDAQLKAMANAAGVSPAGLIVLHAVASDAVPQLAGKLGIEAVFANHDYEPQALSRDAKVQALLEMQGVAFHTFKDHVIFERHEILTLAGKPYTVFTPYKKAWLKKVDGFYLKPYPTEKYAASLAELPAAFATAIPTLQAIGFEKTNLMALNISCGNTGGAELFQDFMARMDDYGQARDFPAIKGPSYLSVHLRFGTVSIRKLAAQALAHGQAGSEGAGVWLGELIWRDFYAQILSNFPHVVSGAFKPEYDLIGWEKGPVASALFAAWCEGRTGYPLVDAAMAQINQTGYMHNRLRMVVASFLCKDLGIDWRLGERYFGEKLNDYDLSSNNGGWQWASSSGCDAQPYFRIFNPVSQSKKFDSDGKFIRRYLPVLQKLPAPAVHSPWAASPVELAGAGVILGKNYPLPVVDHGQARALTLQRYAVVKKP
jgi:deoxyribodipyrimidine photo-lyase